MQKYLVHLLTCDFAYRCLPPMPTAIICIPFIRSAIEMLRANRVTPMVMGCITTKADTAMLIAPTPTRKPLDHLDISLFIIPCTILAIPLNSNANAPNNIKILQHVLEMTSQQCQVPQLMQSPILVRRVDLLGDGAIPIAILSNQTISKATENNRITVYIAIP
jgi:hypothetical protein